jgi:hypothetical protein
LLWSKRWKTETLVVVSIDLKKLWKSISRQRCRGVMVEPNREKAAALKFPASGNFAANIFL